MSDKSRSGATLLAQAGIFPVGSVMVPVTPAVNATTVISRRFGDDAGIDEGALTANNDSVLDGFNYGSLRTPTSNNLVRALCSLEGAAFASLTPSGQSAITVTLLSLLRPGDHLLAVDTATYSTRWFLERRLSELGVEVEYYPPDTSDISAYFRPRTRVVFLESPGAFTFEVQDVPSIARACRRAGIVSVLDNTWAALTFFRPLRSEIDVSVVSLSKNAGGPVGVSLGAVFTNDTALYRKIANEIALHGLAVSADACSATLTSLTTMDLRLERQQQTTSILLEKLGSHSLVRTVFHPSRQMHPGHSLWKRDFSGSNSLISVSLSDVTKPKIQGFLDALEVFRIGYGWGGTISLVSIFMANEHRSVSRCDTDGLCLRIYIGTESCADLTTDIERALEQLAP
ncbi:trans-sulfuration enzyme family protein [Paraburkholderia sp. J67]|uniref:trans-sulfuration enzyme family protein n=1 Tax=Paraburkholderia sp. J67 TaxID=2805435 RepID=UPI002ABE2D8A|nr:PLP-dependent transferase [Paraburkholderia sp. J67]